MTRSCRTCISYKWIEGKVGECRHNPPMPFMWVLPSGPSLLGAPGRANSVGLQVKFVSSWPAVKEEHWCRTGYEVKLNEELEPDDAGSDTSSL